jgi:hypothetical protein
MRWPKESGRCYLCGAAGRYASANALHCGKYGCSRKELVVETKAERRARAKRLRDALRRPVGHDSKRQGGGT